MGDRAARASDRPLTRGSGSSFGGAVSGGVREDETEAHALARLVILVVIGVAVAVVGAVALLLRLVAGALARR